MSPKESRVVRERPAALLRQLGLVSATALVVSNMVGTGIFTSTGFLAAQLGSPTLVLAIWVVGALCALAGALCYSELGVNFPSSGGEYVYLTRAFGPSFGFMTGWISFFAGFSAPIAAAALAFAGYLGFFFPALKQDAEVWTLGSGSYALKIGGAQLAASGLILLFTILNCVGVKRVASVQNVLTGAKLLVLAVFILLAFAVGRGDWANFSQVAPRSEEHGVLAQFAVSLFWIYASYSGWNAATYVAEEVQQPARTLPIALAFGTGLVALLYLLLNVVYIYSTPLAAMRNVLAVGGLAAQNLFGPEVAGVFSALMALALMSTVSAMVTIGPRVYYAMALNRAFFPAAAQVHPTWRTPVVAIVSQGICAMLLTMVSFAGLFTYIGFTLNLSAVAAVASLFVFRRQSSWQRLPVISFAWPLIPGFFVLIGTWMAIYGLLLEPKVSLAAILTVGVGALVYHFRFARKAVAVA